MRPNILFITCDQLRADALGCYGNNSIKTPNIDRIAERGVRFDGMHVASPSCSPNRGSIATGRMPSVNGLRANGYVLPDSELTLMECLRRSGYATYGAGKMHFGPQWRHGVDEIEALMRDGAKGEGAVDPQPKPWELPFYGFEKVAISEDNREGPYADFLREKGLDPWADPHSFTYPQHSTTRSVWEEADHQTTWIAERSLEYINEAASDRPFFLWTSFVDPHHPFNPPAGYDTLYDPDDLPDPVWAEGEMEKWPAYIKQKFEARSGGHEAIGMEDLTAADFRRVKAYYYGMISLIDKQVGRLLDALEEKGFLDSTVIVFTSDHGELLGDHRLLFKGPHFGCVTRVPFLLAGWGLEKAESGALCQSTDIMPTLLEFAGVPSPAGLQGKSLRQAAMDTEIRLYDDLLIEDIAPGMYTVLTEAARLTWHGPGERGELYNLLEDPDELANLWESAEARELKAEMYERLLARLASNCDPQYRRTALC